MVRDNAKEGTSMGRNAYAVPTSAQRNGTAPPSSTVFGGNQRYAVRQPPESTNPEYTVGYSPELKAGGSASGEALPDSIRIGTREPPVRNRNSKEWQAKVDSEFLARHSLEETDPWTMDKRVQQYTTSQPRLPIQTQDRLPTRPTARMAPMGRLFRRPWHIPRNIKDAIGEGAVTHFSLADHKRRYEIMGMKPQGRLGVNHFRSQPRPWDEELFIPPPAGGHGLGGIAGNRTHRL